MWAALAGHTPGGPLAWMNSPQGHPPRSCLGPGPPSFQGGPGPGGDSALAPERPGSRCKITTRRLAVSGRGGALLPGDSDSSVLQVSLWRAAAAPLPSPPRLTWAPPTPRRLCTWWAQCPASTLDPLGLSPLHPTPVPAHLVRGPRPGCAGRGAVSTEGPGPPPPLPKPPFEASAKQPLAPEASL